jgi:hypothetical protein
MKKEKNGAFLLLLMLATITVVPIGCTVADTAGRAMQTIVPAATPMISFDGLSTPSSASYNATELHIPSSIRKYELLTFHIEKMREKLAKNDTITVRIQGVPYTMTLHDSTGKTEGLDPAIHSYQGSLENVKDSEVAFTTGKKVIGGHIFFKGNRFFLESTPKTENGKQIQYFYSLGDVVEEGPPGLLCGGGFRLSMINQSSIPNVTIIHLTDEMLKEDPKLESAIKNTQFSPGKSFTISFACDEDSQLYQHNAVFGGKYLEHNGKLYYSEYAWRS